MTEPDRSNAGTAVLLFLATLASVYLVYGYQWAGGDPLSDPVVARESARFAGSLMAILLAHEMGHYVVARRHGFRLSLPYFIPFPFGFGTFGAIIRLKSPPANRTALLEMGAAGPLCGLVVAIGVMAVGLGNTVEQAFPEIRLSDSPPGMIDTALAWVIERFHLDGAASAGDVPGGLSSLPIAVLANPPVMDMLGTVLLGAPPGRYAELDALALAGWVGCLLTAINLVPIGQLDGGHVFNALFPRWARPASIAFLAVAVVAGVVSPGWAVWGVLLFAIGAWHSLPVPERPPLTGRARLVAALSVLAFALAFMPVPIETEEVPVWEVTFSPPPGTEENASAGDLGATVR